MSDKEIKQNTPKVSSVYGDYLVMLAAPCIISAFYYGVRALGVIAVSVFGALITDMVFCLFLKRKFLLKDLSNIFIGAAIAVMMPAGIPLYVPVFAAVFAVAVAKVPFGGSLRAPFVPAAAGFAFVSVCFKEQIFDYAYNSADKMLGSGSVGSLLLRGSAVHLNAVNLFDIISGNVAGPMGTGCGLLMIACGIVLLIRRKGALLAPIGFIGFCVLWAAVFPRVNASAATSVVMELSAGSLLFAAVFLVTDYSTQPQRFLTKIFYGVVCGFLCMLMRRVGTYEESVCFAILLANGFSPLINSALGRLSSKKKKKASGREEAVE